MKDLTEEFHHLQQTPCGQPIKERDINVVAEPPHVVEMHNPFAETSHKGKVSIMSIERLSGDENVCLAPNADNGLEKPASKAVLELSKAPVEDGSPSGETPETPVQESLPEAAE